MKKLSSSVFVEKLKFYRPLIKRLREHNIDPHANIKKQLNTRFYHYALSTYGNTLQTHFWLVYQEPLMDVLRDTTWQNYPYTTKVSFNLKGDLYTMPIMIDTGTGFIYNEDDPIK